MNQSLNATCSHALTTTSNIFLSSAQNLPFIVECRFISKTSISQSFIGENMSIFSLQQQHCVHQHHFSQSRIKSVDKGQTLLRIIISWHNFVIFQNSPHQSCVPLLLFLMLKLRRVFISLMSPVYCLSLKTDSFQVCHKKMSVLVEFI